MIRIVRRAVGWRGLQRVRQVWSRAGGSSDVTILDVEEERSAANQPSLSPTPLPLNTTRGVSGVFEVEEVVKLIREGQGRQVFVVRVPEELNYVSHLVVVSCMSKRHILALTQSVLKAYKAKRHPSDPIPPVNPADTWVALDLGNVALHMMTEGTREHYDLESLWSVGPRYDPLSLHGSGASDSVLDVLQRHSVSLDDFTPAPRPPAPTSN